MTVICRFDDGGTPRYGIVEGDSVTGVTGGAFGPYRKAGPRLPAAQLRYLPPVIPPVFYAAGLNYKGHAERASALASAGGGRQVPERAEIGYRATSALTGHGSPIVRPADCAEALVAEGELVAVIGPGGVPRHATREQARAAIFGWTIGNDVSARGWQRADRTFWRSKNSDTFKPMGPFLVTADAVDPLSSTTTLAVDGAVAASFPTGDMLFDPHDFIVAMSRYITIGPGDVIWLGTDETASVVPGQEIAITIDGLGTLSNPVTEEKLIHE
ncbi:MAG TPA: fumarylacetoacetate hydrolase family protein [Trebonia sp.]|jgi:2-keto-4-pentenoate hydratase/2-oxohepta-3-ene-1,7-dioic acid hydratase in catechol pathway|nr:fumarylacetoacetate hydrolase family protein [Trebonia sp.]